MKKGFYTLQTKSMSEYGVTTHKDLWEKVKAEGYKGLSVTVNSEFIKKSVDGVESPYYHATFSSSNDDRQGDIVMQVFDLKGFMNNPVYLDSHNYDSIVNILGKIHNINTNGGALNGDIEFCLDNPKGALADKMVAGGFLNTSSIGFIPKVFDADGKILESELLEVSAVAVPANADALFDKKEIKKEEVVETKKEEVVEVKEVELPQRKSVAQIVSKIAIEKENTYNTITKLVKEMIIDGKKEKAKKIHSILRELSK
ncbi:MAG: hypothetical protein WC499_02500 [Patescibacteria group bacterium]